MKSKAILTPKNIDVDEVNEYIINNVIPDSPTDTVYLSSDMVAEDDNAMIYTPEF